MSARHECTVCGLAAGDLPDGVGLEDEYVLAELFDGGLCEGCRSCACPPCPGRGNDGHGLTHCAECCFGSGVEADMDCPTHGKPTADRDELARLIRECNTPPDACPWDLLPEGVRDNWRRDADAVINAGWRKS